MYPKLNPEPIFLSVQNHEYKIPRDKIASSFAGAMAAKECILAEMSPMLIGEVSFHDKYAEVMPICINAANQVGLSAVVETLDFYNPGKGLDNLIKKRLEHMDNPFYPFLEED